MHDEDEPLVADGLVVVTPRPRNAFEGFAHAFNADGVFDADDNLVRLAGDVKDLNVWAVVWD